MSKFKMGTTPKPEALAAFIQGETSQSPVEAPQSPVEPTEAHVATPVAPASEKAPVGASKAAVKRSHHRPKQITPLQANQASQQPTTLEEAEAQLAKLREQARAEAKKTAKFPWQDPDVLESLKTTGVTFRMREALYRKMQWYMEQVPGGISFQKMVERLVDAEVDRFITEREGGHAKQH